MRRQAGLLAKISPLRLLYKHNGSKTTQARVSISKRRNSQKLLVVVVVVVVVVVIRGGGGVSQEESLNEVLKAQLPIIFSDSQWQLKYVLHWYKVSTGRVIEILMPKIMTFSFFKRFWYHSVENTSFDLFPPETSYLSPQLAGDIFTAMLPPCADDLQKVWGQFCLFLSCSSMHWALGPMKMLNIMIMIMII